MIRINRNNIGRISVLAIVFSALLLILSSCGDSGITSTQSSSNNNVTINVKADDNVAGNPFGAVVLTEAKALVTEVEFEKEGSAENESVHIAPFVIHFDLNGGLSEVISAKINAGSFTKLKFQIHKPEDTESIPDSDFREGTSSNQRYSFIIKGTNNGNAFVYKSKKSISLVINFNKTVNLQTSGINITMLLNKLSWFKNGGTEIDPSDPQNENLVDDNLKNSFKEAFEDENKDGHPDN